MDKLSELRELAKALPSYTETIEAVLKRMEASEAELESLRAQRPVAYRWEGKSSGNICYDGIKPLGVISQPLYAEPRPAAAVVPPEHLANIKFAADEAIKDPESIYAQEFFMLLDETFGKKGDYSTPVQAVAVSQLIEALSGQPQKFVVKNFPSRKSSDDYVDEEFTNEDLAAIWNACRLACSVKIKDAGGEVE